MMFKPEIKSKRQIIRVGAAASFGFRAKFHSVKLFEREVGIPNWLFNMEVIGTIKRPRMASQRLTEASAHKLAASNKHQQSYGHHITTKYP